MGACAINALDEAGSSDEAPDFDRVSEGMEIYYYLFYGAFILSSFLAMYKMLRYRKETPEILWRICPFFAFPGKSGGNLYLKLAKTRTLRYFSPDFFDRIREK